MVSVVELKGTPFDAYPKEKEHQSRSSKNVLKLKSGKLGDIVYMKLSNEVIR